MARIERLVNLVAALLDTSQPLTAEDVRAKIAGYDQPNYEAFRRAFERDKEDLRAMGVPLQAVVTDHFSDQADGYIIPKDEYYLPDLHLEPDELAALHLASEAVLGRGEEASRGLLKLSIDAQEGGWRGPRAVWRADLDAEQPLLASLYAAVADRKPVRFGYKRASGEAGTRTIDPYALAHRRGHWYVVGNDHARTAVRSFKVSRIEPPVRKLEGSFEVPGSFDVAHHVGTEAWEVGPDEPGSAVVRFDAGMRWWPEQNMQDLEARDGPDGALDVEIPVANVDALISWVIRFVSGVEILEPVSARERLVEHLRQFMDGDA